MLLPLPSLLCSAYSGHGAVPLRQSLHHTTNTSVRYTCQSRLLHVSRPLARQSSSESNTCIPRVLHVPGLLSRQSGRKRNIPHELLGRIWPEFLSRIWPHPLCLAVDNQNLSNQFYLIYVCGVLQYLVARKILLFAILIDRGDTVI